MNNKTNKGHDHNLIDDLFSKGVPPLPLPTNSMIIYGAGNTGKLLAKTCSANQIKIIAFLDSNAKPGQTINGIPVLLPSEAGSLTVHPVIVAVFNREKTARFSVIEKSLQSLGFNSVFSFEQYYLSHPQGFPDLFWLTRPTFYADHRVAIQAADQLWSDEQSRQLYRALLLLRMTGRDTVPVPVPHLQYMPDDIPLFPPPYRFIDIGAFDGDTLEALRHQKGLFESIFAFEPDINNFRNLVRRIKEQGPFSTGITCLYPCGVGQSCDTVSFISDGSEAAKVCDKDNPQGIRTPVVSIDAILHHAKPNYIKLDVEGFEEQVLFGLKKTIERDRPMLAVCVYHKPADLFSLPLLLASWGYSADFYLRLHGEHTFDTVLYVIPKPRVQE
jgi:FkbM family methyltransferase